MRKHLKRIHLDNLKLEHIQVKNAQEAWNYIEKIDLTDRNAVPFHMHIGMRTIKTVVAVFICGLIGGLFRQPPLFSMFAAVLCQQNKTNDTIKSAYNRMLGTLVGGVYSVSFVYAWWLMGLSTESVLFYCLISVMLIPVIFTTLYIRKPTTTGLSCIVFIAISLSEFHDMNPLFSALWRMFDTLIGIGVIVLIEICFPYRPPAPEESESPAAESSPLENTKAEETKIEK